MTIISLWLLKKFNQLTLQNKFRMKICWVTKMVGIRLALFALSATFICTLFFYAHTLICTYLYLHIISAFSLIYTNSYLHILLSAHTLISHTLVEMQPSLKSPLTQNFLSIFLGLFERSSVFFCISARFQYISGQTNYG